MRTYPAEPVFLPDAPAIGAAKKVLCNAAGVARAGHRPGRTGGVTIRARQVPFFAFLMYSGGLQNRGKLPNLEKEVVTLRVGHLRKSEYELRRV